MEANPFAAQPVYRRARLRTLSVPRATLKGYRGKASAGRVPNQRTIAHLYLEASDRCRIGNKKEITNPLGEDHHE